MEGKKLVYVILNTVVVLYVIYFVIRLLADNDIVGIPVEVNVALIFVSWVLIGFVVGVAVGVTISQREEENSNANV